MPKPKLIGKPKNTDIAFSDRKLEVLRAAAGLFNRNGYHNTTMDDIAAALSVTKPALYYYAPSKDSLLYHVIEFAIDETQKTTDEIERSSQSGAEKLKVFFSRWLEIALDDFGRCLIQSRNNTFERNTQKKNTEARRQVHDKVLGFVRLGISDGSLGPHDPQLVTLALFDCFNGVALWFDPRGAHSIEVIFEHHWQLLFDGLSRRGKEHTVDSNKAQND